ncbi:MAG: WecB/TagA/CpsF family glycosyltransferase, partial [Chloroflexota bacterium]
MVAETLAVGRSSVLDALQGRSLLGSAAGGPAVGARHRVALAGALIDQVDLMGALDRIRSFLASGTGHQIVTVNLDFLSIAERDPHFRETINRADLAVADGMPLVWASQLTHRPLPERIAGVDLVDASCRIAAQTGHGVYLLGAAPGIAKVAARRMAALYPGLRIAGICSPPFSELLPKENERIVRHIREAAPGFLFVALGAPRQDLWIRTHLEQLQVPVCMGVGCVLDLFAGNVKRAPVWMQRGGLE